MAIWIDCPACGTAKAGDFLDFDVERDAAGRPLLRDGKYRKTLPCPTCKAPVRFRAITIRSRKPGRPAPRCGGACLNGKRSCDCQCNGRCHGASECRCETAAPQLRTRGDT